MVKRMSYLTVATDLVGTSVDVGEKITDIVTPSDSEDVLALINLDVSTGVATTAEAVQSRTLWKLRTLANEDIALPNPGSYGGGAATNMGPLVIPAHAGLTRFIPLAQPGTGGGAGEGAFGNKKITATNELTIEGTQDLAVQASVVTVNSSDMPADIMNNVGRKDSPIGWSESVQEDDIKATTQIFASSITIPGWINHIKFIHIQLGLDALMTDSEMALGFLSLSGTIPGVAGFMEIPFSSIGGELGTNVSDKTLDLGTILPCYIDMSTITADATLKFTSNMLVAMTGALSVQVTVFAV